jgi:hypothetical protein
MDSTGKTKIQKKIKKAKFVKDTVKKNNYNKQVLCKYCERCMWDSNIKQHMKKMHANLPLIKNTNGIQEEIKNIRKLVEDKQVEQMQEEGPSSSCYEQSLSKSTDFEKKLLQYNAIYLDKMETGKHVYEAIVKGTVVKEALPKKYRNALKIYLKSIENESDDEKEEVRQ